ncbi:MAG: DUF3800 domain-containing protein [Saprospiraceae bacterium]|nr:DUF3800 domain-containing protein [Saprospiraceae bacterium]
MDFEVYCDESGLEALTKTDAHQFVAIGGIWIPSDFRHNLKMGLNTIKQKHNVYGELKWKKLSPMYFELYKDAIDFFFQTDYIRFRVIVIQANKVDHYKYNNADAELGFYKFYYQLLHHWIYDFNNYDIFLDHKINRNKGRLKELERVLDSSNLTSDIKQVQGLPSEQSVGIQLADILTGMVFSKLNGAKPGSSKYNLIQHVETTYLQREIGGTPKWEEKFNVFKINLQGGW